MKKIILILALLSLGVSKAQVVGGYLPVNSTKSATMGGLRVNGTSTFTGNALFSSSVGIGVLPNNALSVFQSVKGTGSVNIGESVAGFGALWFDTPVSASNYALRGNAANTSINSTQRQQHNINNTTKGVWTSTGLRVGSSSDPTAVLDVTGDAKVSSTFSLGSANLTGGNTGTVAVLSDVIGYINHAYTTGNFSNNQSYIMDDLPTAVKIVLASRNYLPKAITINQYNASIYVLGTPGSGGTTGTLVLQVNGVNTNTVNTALTFTSGVNTFSGTLTQTVAAGSYISTLLMTPNFTTNPTNVMPAVQWWYKQ